jgi:hypothetical protein
MFARDQAREATKITASRLGDGAADINFET